MRRRTVALVLLVAFLPAADARGQTDSQPGRVCFRARPAPTCRAFWITEITAYQRFWGTAFTQEYPGFRAQHEHLGGHLSWEIGGMVNRGSESAVGAAVQVGFGYSGNRRGLTGRYRRWLAGGRGTLDYAAGLLRGQASLPYPHVSVGAHGLTGDVSMGWMDLVALSGRADLLRAANGDYVSAVYGGVRLGSYPAIVATAVYAALIALLVTALAGGT